MADFGGVLATNLGNQVGRKKGVDASRLTAIVRRPARGSSRLRGVFQKAERGSPGSRKKGVDERNRDDNVRRPRKTGNWFERVLDQSPIRV